jgi:hypothetical protein
VAARRAIIEFSPDGDPWPVILEWAQQSKYLPIQRADGAAHFQKGLGFWVAPQNLHVTVAPDTVRLEAWISANTFVRAMSLCILPSEITIESGGFTAALPRKMARKDVNRLLETLGQPALG